MKYLLFTVLLVSSGLVIAQPHPFLDYTIYDYLVSATHPNGCPPEYVTGLPDDSTWVNMLPNSVMTGYFGMAWKDLPGADLLLEASFHHHNYSVRLILEGGNFSGAHPVVENDWIDYPFV
ncbi:MAG: hypothetical protein KBA14_06140, partial [Saprospiraceae bacterium]|nr:hypothetical protein [Saprospiraceae bacterium]